MVSENIPKSWFWIENFISPVEALCEIVQQVHLDMLRLPFWMECHLLKDGNRIFLYPNGACTSWYESLTFDFSGYNYVGLLVLFALLGYFDLWLLIELYICHFYVSVEYCAIISITNSLLLNLFICLYIYIYVGLGSSYTWGNSKQCYITQLTCYWIHILKFQPLNYMFYMFLTCMPIFKPIRCNLPYNP